MQKGNILSFLREGRHKTKGHKGAPTPEIQLSPISRFVTHFSISQKGIIRDSRVYQVSLVFSQNQIFI